jgi:hypothetical protein
MSQVDAPWSYLLEIGITERHFNDIESRYRALASTWVLACFAGMGFAATQNSEFFVRAGGAGVVIYAISLAGSFGVQLLWLVDLLGYHHLLAANYLEGLRIEASDPNLPRVRWNMWSQGIVESRVKIFYAGCSAAPLPFGVAAVVEATHAWTPGFLWVIVALAAVPASVACYLWRRSRNAWLETEVAGLRRVN